MGEQYSVCGGAEGGGRGGGGERWGVVRWGLGFGVAGRAAKA